MKVRIISALIAIIIVLPFIIIGGKVYELGVGIVAVLGFIEMLKLKKTHNEFPKVPTILALFSLILIVYSNVLLTDLNYTSYIFLSLGLLIPTIFYSKEIYTTKDAFSLIGIVLFLGVAFNSFITVRLQGLNIFIYLILIPIMTDTCALIFGSKFGKHKMCPKISPHKSWEGAFAGLIFGTIVPCIFFAITVGNFSWKVLLITIMLSFSGQIGDLVFSKIKRENGIKDFSNIMPGHGGILDRLDSTITIFMTYIFLFIILF